MTASEKTKFIILQEDTKHFKEDFKEFKEETKEELKEIKDIATEGNIKFDRIYSELMNDEASGKVGYFEQTRINTGDIGRNSIKLSKFDIKLIKIGVFFMTAGTAIGWLGNKFLGNN